MNKEKKPIALDAYEKLADAYAEMIEAKPTEDYRRADPEGYEKVSKRPSFHNIRAVPSP